MSDIQRNLLDINQRYEILGEKLTDRHNELMSTLSAVKAYLTDVQAVLTFLDDKELSTQPVDQLPTQEDEAKRKLEVCFAGITADYV